jgi:hypothetical protein
MLRKLVDCKLELGEPSGAEAWARESLQLIHGVGDRRMTVFALARVARITAESGRKEEAGLLWGAIEAEEERSRMGAWAKERDRLSGPVFDHEGPEFEHGREKGRRLSLMKSSSSRSRSANYEPGSTALVPSSAAHRSYKRRCGLRAMSRSGAGELAAGYQGASARK